MACVCPTFNVGFYPINVNFTIRSQHFFIRLHLNYRANRMSINESFEQIYISNEFAVSSTASKITQNSTAVTLNMNDMSHLRVGEFSSSSGKTIQQDRIFETSTWPNRYSKQRENDKNPPLGVQHFLEAQLEFGEYRKRGGVGEQTSQPSAPAQSVNFSYICLFFCAEFSFWDNCCVTFFSIPLPLFLHLFKLSGWKIVFFFSYFLLFFLASAWNVSIHFAFLSF